MRDLSRMLPEMIERLDAIWEVNQPIQNWVHGTFEEIERSISDEQEFERQAVSVTFFAYSALHKLLEAEKPRMNRQEFQQYWEAYKAKEGI